MQFQRMAFEGRAFRSMLGSNIQRVRKAKRPATLVVLTKEHFAESVSTSAFVELQPTQTVRKIRTPCKKCKWVRFHALIGAVAVGLQEGRVVGVGKLNIWIWGHLSCLKDILGLTSRIEEGLGPNLNGDESSNSRGDWK